MTKVETSISSLKKDIELFYNKNMWHLLCVNGLDLGDKLEIQWIFANYSNKDDVVIYFLYCDYDEPIPSINSIIPSAWVNENELKDMLGANIEGAIDGLFLEDDMQRAPLRKKNG